MALDGGFGVSLLTFEIPLIEKSKRPIYRAVFLLFSVNRYGLSLNASDPGISRSMETDGTFELWAETLFRHPESFPDWLLSNCRGVARDAIQDNDQTGGRSNNRDYWVFHESVYNSYGNRSPVVTANMRLSILFYSSGR